MTTNPYIKNFNSTQTQALVEGLILSSIKMYGHDIKYLPRTILSRDNIFNEAKSSEFVQAASIEAYIKNIEGFGGQGKFLSQIGIEVRDQIVFTISKLRFEQAKSNKLFAENAFCLQLEDKLKYQPNDTRSLVLEGLDHPVNITFDIPREGDLIYMPLTKKIFEIKHVNYESIFYQFGALQTYDLECELFEYNSETIQTGDPDIDHVIEDIDNDMLNYQISLEVELGSVKLEDDSYEAYLIQEEYAAGVDANNEDFTDVVDPLIDWSEKSPLINYNGDGKW